ncbi:hypothetical protein [Myxococcus sp. Y35]|uniref:hypothetical protein n=1 Tax=Pseudomyxococcus flavus TaxID=3115648 RepID=UPI003CF522D8
MNFYDEPSPSLLWESSLGWVLALAMSVGLAVGYWLLWGPRQPGDGLLRGPSPVAGRLMRWGDSLAWISMAVAIMGPMVFIGSWLLAALSLEHSCIVMEGHPSYSYSPFPWFFAALGIVVGGGVYAHRARKVRDARDVLLAGTSTVDPARLPA